MATVQELVNETANVLIELNPNLFEVKQKSLGESVLFDLFSQGSPETLIGQWVISPQESPKFTPLAADGFMRSIGIHLSKLVAHRMSLFGAAALKQPAPRGAIETSSVNISEAAGQAADILPRGRRGRKPTPPAKRLELVIGWLEVPESKTQKQYCSDKGISVSSLRDWLSEYYRGELNTN